MDINYFKNNIFYITGSKKNAGKTTFLNLLSKNLDFKITFARLTIGVDGEREDAFFGNQKPLVYVRKGEYLVTNEQAALSSNVLFEYIHVFPFKTALGKLVLLKVLREGNVELTGPRSNRDLSIILERIKEEGITTVFVDGAVNRVTQTSSADNAKIIYICMIDKKNLDKQFQELERVILLSKVKTDKDQRDHYYFEGALTESKLESIPTEVTKVLVDDFSKIFLNTIQLKKFLRKYDLMFKNTYEFVKFIVNFKDITKDEIIKKISQKHQDDRIMLNPFIFGEER